MPSFSAALDVEASPAVKRLTAWSNDSQFRVTASLYLLLIAHYQSDGAKAFGEEPLIRATGEAVRRSRSTFEMEFLSRRAAGRGRPPARSLRTFLHSRAGGICSFTVALTSTKRNDAMAPDNRL